MAKVAFKQSIAGFRGKMGGLIYREQNGETIVVAEYRRKNRPSEAQRQVRTRFEAAQAYAALVLAHPVKREHYRRLAAATKRAANTLLISNFLTPPTVDRVDLTEFHGGVGATIWVLATDAIEVVKVTVAAYGTGGRVLETGPAHKDQGVWSYRCTTALKDVVTKFEVTAENRAGTQGTTIVAV